MDQLMWSQSEPMCDLTQEFGDNLMDNVIEGLSGDQMPPQDMHNMMCALDVIECNFESHIEWCDLMEVVERDLAQDIHQCKYGFNNNTIHMDIAMDETPDMAPIGVPMMAPIVSQNIQSLHNNVDEFEAETNQWDAIQWDPTNRCNDVEDITSDTEGSNNGELMDLKCLLKTVVNNDDVVPQVVQPIQQVIQNVQPARRRGRPKKYANYKDKLAAIRAINRKASQKRRDNQKLLRQQSARDVQAVQQPDNQSGQPLQLITVGHLIIVPMDTNQFNTIKNRFNP